MAEPTMPAKVWNENTWPMRADRRMARQQRIIGRVVDGVAEAGDAIHGDEDPERADDAGDREAGAVKKQAEQQHRPRADASTRKPTGVCSVPETTLNTVSASASCV